MFTKIFPAIKNSEFSNLDFYGAHKFWEFRITVICIVARVKLPTTPEIFHLYSKTDEIFLSLTVIGSFLSFRKKQKL